MDQLYRKIIYNKFRSEGLLSYYIAIISMIVIPIDHFLLPYIMALWILIWFFEIPKRINRISQITFQSKLLFILFVLFYAWQLIGIIYSDNRTEGWVNITIRLSLFLFPLILVSPGEMIQRKLKTLLRTFALSTFIYVFFCFGFALYRSIHVQNGIWTFNSHLPDYEWLSYFYGSDLAIFQHPSYLSMYILFSVFIVFESFLDISLKKRYKPVWLVISIILITSIYFLSARSGMLSVIISVPFYFLLKARNIRGYPFAWIYILVIVVVLLPLALIIQHANKNSKGFFQKSLTETAREDGRIVIWNAANKISRKNLIFGVGTGAATEALVHEYERIGEKEMAEERFNAHNQFIETLLENGIISLALFLSILFTMFYIAITGKNLMYFMFVLIIILFFTFESMLNRLGGVSFFALFSFLLIRVNPNRDNAS